MTREEFVESIKIGHNLGNALECMEPIVRNGAGDSGVKLNVKHEITDINGYHDFRIEAQYPDGTYSYYYSFEELWSNTPITPELLSHMKSIGIQAVRLPVNMIGHIIDSTDHTIDPLWLKSVKNVILWAVDAGLKCILDLHTDFAALHASGSFLSLVYPDNYTPDQDAVGRLMCVWKQIAEYMNDVPADALAFELANEFRISDLEAKTSMEQLTEYSMRYYRNMYKVIRDVGGNASERFLIIGGYRSDLWYCTELIADMIQNELDDKCIISANFYTPWQFTVCGISDTWSYDGEVKQQMDEYFARLNHVREITGIPIIITEYGVGADENCMASKNKLNVCEYIYFVMKWFFDNNLAAFIWDPGYIIHRDTFNYGIPFYDNILDNISIGGEYDIVDDFNTHEEAVTFMRYTTAHSITLKDIESLDNVSSLSIKTGNDTSVSIL